MFKTPAFAPTGTNEHQREVCHTGKPSFDVFCVTNAGLSLEISRCMWYSVK